MNENENFLESESILGNDADKIKQQIVKHKEFQRALGAKQPSYDATNRMGRTLKDKCPKLDIPTIQEMLTQMKNKWNNICGKSVDRSVSRKHKDFKFQITITYIRLTLKPHLSVLHW